MQRPSDEELVQVVSKIAKRLARLYKFGYHEVEDLIQECYIMALGALDKYDSSRPLSNFLAIHLRNRLNNLKRDKFQRITKPCERCPLAAWIKDKDICKIYEIKEDCTLYHTWTLRNSAKKNLMQPTFIEGHEPTRPGEFFLAEFNEYFVILREKLSPKNQVIMYKIMNGDKVRPGEMYDFRHEAQEILGNEVKRPTG